MNFRSELIFLIADYLSMVICFVQIMDFLYYKPSIPMLFVNKLQTDWFGA